MKDIHEIIAEDKKSLRPHEKRAVEQILGDKMKSERSGRAFSQWEKRVRTKLRRSEIKFEEKPRVFPIEVDGKIIKYTPDFILDLFLFFCFSTGLQPMLMN